MFDITTEQKKIFKTIIQTLNEKLNINQLYHQQPIQNYIQKYNINIERIKQLGLIEEDIVKKIYQLLSISKINQKNSYLAVQQNGTTIITNIFEKQVDDNTLVISSMWQHPSVIINLSRCKNIQIIDLINFSINNFQYIIKNTKFEKVFLYFIGTIRCNGIIIQQIIFQNIIKILKKYNKQYKIMLDAVHELFLSNRDYTIFDYIVYTAHAIIDNHELGILISKERIYQDINDYKKIILTQHYRGLLILKRLIMDNKIIGYKNYLINYFSDIFKDQKYKDITNIYNTQYNTFCIYANNIYFTEKIQERFGKKDLIQFEFKDNIHIIYMRILYAVIYDKDFVQSKLQNLKKLLLTLPYIEDESILKIKNRKIIQKQYLKAIDKLSEQQKEKLREQFEF